MKIMRRFFAWISRLWGYRSIRTRAIFTQIVIIVVPVTICTLLIINQILAEIRNDTAVTSYQYCRYIVQVLDTNVRQMESMANTIAGNRYVREYVAMEEGTEKDAFYQTHVAGLLIYAYNRYLPTHDISIYTHSTLNDLSTEGQRSFMRSTYRLWTFDTANQWLPQIRFYNEFTGDKGQHAVIAFYPTPSMIVDTAATISSILKQNCFVFSTDGSLIYKPETVGEEEQEILRKIAEQTPEGYSTLENKRIGYALHCETLPLVFVSTQQLGNVLLQLKRLWPPALLYLGLMLACVYFSYQTFFKGITQRVLRLSHDCESISLNNLEKTDTQLAVPVRGNDEIGRLSISINNMLTRIVDLTRINQRETIVSQIAAYDALAAQIQPHFIYNTLENLRMMAEANDDEQVADLLYALGRMLRLSISDASSTGDIRTEMEHVALYLQLQQMRLNGNLQYQIDQPMEELAQIKCPRFLLQPIVENAIKYGFQTKKAPGNIRVSAGVSERKVFLRVIDDGAGFTIERLAEIESAMEENAPISNTRGGIGLVNVNARLKMFYGDAAGLSLESSLEKGTICTLWLAVMDRSLPVGETGDIRQESGK